MKQQLLFIILCITSLRIAHSMHALQEGKIKAAQAVAAPQPIKQASLDGLPIPIKKLIVDFVHNNPWPLHEAWLGRHEVSSKFWNSLFLQLSPTTFAETHHSQIHIFHLSEDHTIQEIGSGESTTENNEYTGEIEYLIKISDNLIATAAKYNHGYQKSWQSEVNIWDISNPKTPLVIKKIRYPEIEDHKNWIYSLAKISDSLIAIGLNNGTVDIWDIDQLKKITTLQGPSRESSISAIIKITDTAIGAASEHTIHIWDIVDLKQPKLLDSLDGHSHSVRALIMLTNTSMVSASWDETMRIWDLSDIHTIRCLKTVKNCGCNCIKLTESLLLTADQFFNTSLWDITYPNNPRYLCKINKDHDAKAVVPCGKRNSFLLGNILYEPDNNALACYYTLPFNNQIRLEALVKQLRRLKKELAREWDKQDRRLYLNDYGFKWFKAMPESIQGCLKTHFTIADKPAPKSSCVIC